MPAPYFLLVAGVGVGIRILYTDEGDEKEARSIITAIKRALERRGYVVTVSKRYRNKKNDGGRYYLKLKRAGG